MRKLIPLLVLLAAAVARAAAPGELEVDTKSSSLTYHLVHKMHKVDGVSHQVTGKARLLPDGRAQVMIRVPAQSFDSGNVNRDAHMKEVVEAARFPTVELKALGDGLTPPASFPATANKTFKAQLAFHGVEQVMQIPVALTWDSATRVRADASFTISLDAFKVERPSLMFIKVDDALKIDARLVFVR